MVKNLYLLRHADAEVTAGTGLDIDRELSPKGHKEADSLAVQMLKKHISFDVILCSTALRVRQTYDHIASAVGDSSPQYLDKFYNPSLDTLLGTLKNLKDLDNSVLIISHNPTMSDLATYLTGEPLHFSPGILKYLQLDIKSWDDIADLCAKLVWSIPY